MKNLKRLGMASCALAVGLSICAFAARAPGGTLATALGPAVPGPPQAGCYYFAGCSGFDVTIAANAVGYDSQGIITCDVKDYDGSTHVTTCPSTSTKFTTSVVKIYSSTHTKSAWCSSTAKWGDSGGNSSQCNVTLDARVICLTNNDRSCYSTNFLAIGTAKK
jgi:hypothetical protein